MVYASPIWCTKMVYASPLWYFKMVHASPMWCTKMVYASPIWCFKMVYASPIWCTKMVHASPIWCTKMVHASPIWCTKMVHASTNGPFTSRVYVYTKTVNGHVSVHGACKHASSNGPFYITCISLHVYAPRWCMDTQVHIMHACMCWPMDQFTSRVYVYTKIVYGHVNVHGACKHVLTNGPFYTTCMSKLDIQQFKNACVNQWINCITSTSHYWLQITCVFKLDAKQFRVCLAQILLLIICKMVELRAYTKLR